MIEEVRAFASPFYADKDIMHDLSHIERILVTLDDLIEKTSLDHDREIIEVAAYLHGFIYSHEEQIREFLQDLGIAPDRIRKILNVAWESQKESSPTTNEGLLLHDAHMLEGGYPFEIIKSLITGSVRGQSLEETMIYIERNLLHKGQCYSQAGKREYEIMKRRTIEIYQELNQGLKRKI